MVEHAINIIMIKVPSKYFFKMKNSEAFIAQIRYSQTNIELIKHSLNRLLAICIRHYRIINISKAGASMSREIHEENIF